MSTGVLWRTASGVKKGMPFCESTTPRMYLRYHRSHSRAQG